ncbi:hypothetical protein [Blastococcus sp. SYSU D00820]
MRGLTHPLSRAVYELCEGGVQVTTPDGRVGVFTPSGRWLSGDKIPVDIHMCEWVGNGPTEPEDVSKNRRFRSLVSKEKTL